MISKGKIITISSMSKVRIASFLVLLTLIAGCYNPFAGIMDMFGGGGGGDDNDRDSVLPSRVTDPTAKMLLAIGGVVTGRDEIVIEGSDGNPRDFSGVAFECVSDLEIVKVLPRPGFTTEAAGSGVKIVPTASGVAAITCTAAGEDLGLKYEVTVPPQSLIQLIFAEARGVIAAEATVDEGSGLVTEDSVSPTAQALGSVIRNRIWFTNSKDKVDLFKADPDTYDADPPASYYDAIITADDQFAPVGAGDTNHTAFLDAERRDFVDDADLPAYDQIVLTAGGVFNGDIEDSTTGAFAFYSPTAAEWDKLSLAWSLFYQVIPEGAGVADSDYPSLDPVQVLIHPDVPKENGIPAFVFVRMRTSDDYAVVNQP